MAKHKLRVGYIGLSIKPYFSVEMRQRERAIEGLTKLSKEWEFELVAVAEEISSEDDSRRAANFFRGQKLDFLLIQNSSCSMGEQLLPLVDVAPRLGLWATPDVDLEGEIKIHSLVSMTHYASILKRYLRHEEHPFKWFYGHVETEEFQRRFKVTVRALTAVKNIEHARIGWVGGLSPGFHDMIFDERKLFSRLGVNIEQHELGELVMRAQKLDKAPVQAQAAVIRSGAVSVSVRSDESFERVTRLYMALKDLAHERGYDALAVQCWTKAQEIYNVVPCMAYSWLGSEDGIAVSCEGDVQGAISMYLLGLLTGNRGAATLLDMTALDPQTQAMMMWHCGVSPRHFANADGIKWVDHTTLGRKTDIRYGVAGDQLFAPQKDTTVTYVGDDGGSLLVVRSSIIEHHKKGFDGTRGWFAEFELNKQPIELMDLLNTLTVRGHEHHFAVDIGDVTSELMEFAAWKKLRLIEKVPYADYLQIEGVNV
jgi:L-fucose isomerase-like protein